MCRAAHPAIHPAISPPPPTHTHTPPPHLEYPLLAVAYRRVLKGVLPLHRLHGHLSDVMLGQQLPHLRLHLGEGLLQAEGAGRQAWMASAGGWKMSDWLGLHLVYLRWLALQRSRPALPCQPALPVLAAPLTCSSGMSFFLAAGSVAAAASSSAISSLPTGSRGTTSRLRCMPRTTVQHETCCPW